MQQNPKYLLPMSLDAAHGAVDGVKALAKQSYAGRCNKRRGNGGNKRRFYNFLKLL